MDKIFFEKNIEGQKKEDGSDITPSSCLVNLKKDIA
jgi:hypothetical protein